MHEIAEASTSALAIRVTHSRHERKTKKRNIKMTTCLAGLDLPPLLSSEPPSVSLWRGRDKATQVHTQKFNNLPLKVELLKSSELTGVLRFLEKLAISYTVEIKPIVGRATKSRAARSTRFHCTSTVGCQLSRQVGTRWSPDKEDN